MDYEKEILGWIFKCVKIMQREDPPFISPLALLIAVPNECMGGGA